MRIVAVLLAATFTALPSVIGYAQVYKCEIDGKIVFSDHHCADSSDQKMEQKDYDTRDTGVGGIYGSHLDSRPHSRNRYPERRTYEQHRPLLGWGDKEQIRRLEIRKQELQDDLDRLGGYGLGNYGKARAIGEQIRGLDGQIMQIRANPTGH